MSEPTDLRERLDTWARAHPRLVLAALVAAAVVVTVLGLSSSEAPIVLYQDF